MTTPVSSQIRNTQVERAHAVGLKPTASVGRAVEVELPPDIFDVKTNIPLIHQVVVAQQAAARQGTHSTRTRGEVRGGGKKPYRQKGTGRARQGSTRAPHYVGGGAVFGPKPRDYSQRTPKKMKVAALKGALSDRARHGRIYVLDGYGLGEKPSTRSAVRVLKSVVTDFSHSRLLCVLMREDAVERRSLRNLPNVHLLAVDQLNTYDVLLSDHVVFTVDSLRWFIDAKRGRQESPSARTTPWAARVDTGLLKQNASVATQFGDAALVQIGERPQANHNPILTAAHEAAKKMTNVESYRSSEPTVDGWSVSSEAVEYVALERHTDHALATWPTTMTADDALNFFRAMSARVSAVYANGDDYYEATGGKQVEWQQVAALRNLTFLRVDLEGQSLMWETPDEDALVDNRFVLIEPRIGFQALLSLVRSTTQRDVIGLLKRVVTGDDMVLTPLTSG